MSAALDYAKRKARKKQQNLSTGKTLRQRAAEYVRKQHGRTVWKAARQDGLVGPGFRESERNRAKAYMREGFGAIGWMFWGWLILKLVIWILRALENPDPLPLGAVPEYSEENDEFFTGRME